MELDEHVFTTVHTAPDTQVVEPVLEANQDTSQDGLRKGHTIQFHRIVRTEVAERRHSQPLSRARLNAQSRPSFKSKVVHGNCS